MIACEGNSEETVGILTSDADIDYWLQDNRKKNALYYAIENKNKERGEKYIRMILGRCPDLV